MDITEILNLADRLISKDTRKELDHLPKVILEGTLQGKTYSQIAEENYVSESHVRSIGSKLWKTLSKVLGEEITKANFRAILENGRIYNNIAPAILSDNVTNNINICQQNCRASPSKPHSQPTQTPAIIDLDKAPEIINFYGRTEELSTLSAWMTRDNLRLISLIGISGIGKTALSLRLIDEIKTNFNYIIYRTLRFSPTLATTLTNLLQIFSPETDAGEMLETKLSQLQKHLQKHRCCIIFDDLQTLFVPGKLAGQYQSNYQDYRQFFQLLATVPHQSCLLLISREKIEDIVALETENYPVRSFRLNSLGDGAEEILQKRGLSNRETWKTLIANYQGNPRWLDLAATTIQELFDGKVAEFIEYETLILPAGLQSELELQFQRLSDCERVVIEELAAGENQPISIGKIVGNLQPSIGEVVNAIQSLKMRLLLDTFEENNLTFFSLNPIWRQYLKNPIQS